MYGQRTRSVARKLVEEWGRRIGSSKSRLRRTRSHGRDWGTDRGVRETGRKGFHE